MCLKLRLVKRPFTSRSKQCEGWDTKLDRFLAKNQHNQRKLLCFVNICSPDLFKSVKYDFQSKFSMSRISSIFRKWYFVTKIVLTYIRWEKIVLVMEKTFEIRGWRPRIFKIFEITRTIYSNSEKSEQFLVTECFFNLFLEVSHVW